jgi:hypothetical protein
MASGGDDDLSAFMKSFEVPDVTQLDLPELEEQVAQLAVLLESLSDRSAQRRLRFAGEISDLEATIDREKRRYSESLRLLLSDQRREVDSLLADQRDELGRIAAGQSGVAGSCDAWSEMAADLDEVRSNLETSERQIRAAHAQHEQDELSIARHNRAQEAAAQRLADRQMDQVRLESARAEIAELAALRRQQLRRQWAIVTDCIESRNATARLHDGLVRALRDEGAKRERMFAAHLAVVRQQIEKQQQRCDADVVTARAAIEDLRRIRTETVRRCAKQLQATADDVRRMERVLVEDHSLPPGKSDRLESENAALTQRVDTLTQQLQKVRAQIATAAEILKEDRAQRRQWSVDASPS